MPCDIGFKSYVKATIPAPQPQTFAKKVEAPAIDADLLAKLGEEDSEFLEWASELDTRPLLEEAVRRTMKAMPDLDGLDLELDDRGMLQIKGKFLDAGEKRRLEERAGALGERWQFEILGIVAELLDYTATVTAKGKELVLEAEEAGKSHPCDYIKVTQKDGDATLVFEHFKSKGALELETAKFLALAERLGVKIAVKTREVKEGDPFPEEHRHAGGHKHGHAHPHRHKHGHDHDDE